MNTDNKTSNQYYTKSEESILGTPNLTLTTQKGQSEIIYIFWNGNMSSSYLVIDLLLQDKPIQPLYIERYTILKTLEHDNLEILTKQYKEYKQREKDTQDKLYNISHEQNKYFINIKQYLEDVARIKKKQMNETTQLEIFRQIILKQYPEFQQNFLPTQYITTITKDLEHTSNFFSILKDISPQYYNGIELLEQVTRFLKYYKPICNIANTTNTANSINATNLTNPTSLTGPRIIMGYTKDSKNIELVNKILLNANILDIKIDIPLQDIDNNTIKYVNVKFFPNNIMKYFT
jgi:hypothetical protein